MPEMSAAGAMMFPEPQIDGILDIILGYPSVKADVKPCVPFCPHHYRGHWHGKVQDHLAVEGFYYRTIWDWHQNNF